MPAIDDYLGALVAAGQSTETIKFRGQQLGKMARELGCRPADVTAKSWSRGWAGTRNGRWNTDVQTVRLPAYFSYGPTEPSGSQWT
jgi:hypothetical protein